MLETKSRFTSLVIKGWSARRLPADCCERASTTSSPRREMSSTCGTRPPSTPGSGRTGRNTSSSWPAPSAASCQLHAAGRVPLRQHDDPRDGRPRGAPTGVKKLLYLGSSCIYPRDCPQPIREEDLLTGPLEPTNDAYAIAKIAGIKLVPGLPPAVRLQLHLRDADEPLRAERQLRPAADAHVLPALIRKFHEAAQAAATARSSSGAPARRAASSCTLTTSPTRASSSWTTTRGARTINVGTGEDCTHPRARGD